MRSKQHKGMPPELFGRPLTHLEVGTLKLVSQGVPYTSIARTHGVAYSTISQRMIKVREKLGAKNNAHAVTIAFSRGLI